MLEQFYEAAHGDYDDVLARLRSPERITRFLHMFAKDPSYASLEDALAAGDEEAAFRASHTLKGTAGDMGLTQLASTSSAVCEALRAHQLAAAEKLMPSARDAYQLFTAAYQQYLVQE